MCALRIVAAGRRMSSDEYAGLLEHSYADSFIAGRGPSEENGRARWLGVWTLSSRKIDQSVNATTRLRTVEPITNRSKAAVAFGTRLWQTLGSRSRATSSSLFACRLLSRLRAPRSENRRRWSLALAGRKVRLIPRRRCRFSPVPGSADGSMYAWQALWSATSTQ
jgi:hypothetical protein